MPICCTAQYFRQSFMALSFFCGCGGFRDFKNLRLMHKWLRYALVFLAFVALAFIRFRESVLFYDPLIHFFYGDYQYLELPEVDWVKYSLDLTLRFMVNTLLSLAILWLVFRESSILRLAAILYGLLLLIMLPLFIGLWHISEAGNYFALFAVRRFLIQPIFIFVLLPAFYYYRKVKS